ncbi:heavy metal-binding domain-containing protein [Flavobacterium silvisoli]|uniref:heavy metal-binding domain-containing protein n=1 Tax=Flavobacterium silvisoli TaxID=2529433 RepID=UPI0018771F89|nr:heavy metal-binding domain-containing protein [Flavobacterium silvisoli]
MKKIVIATALIAFSMVSCKPKENDTTATQEQQIESPKTQNDSTAALKSTAEENKHEAEFACPMHPEVHGKKDAECPKCGMKLTEPVLKK